jgi:hypothetical protein
MVKVRKHPPGRYDSGLTGHDAIALEIMGRSLLQIDIGFVQQDYGIPVACSLEVTKET